MFIPYRAKIKITVVPWATIAIALVCLLVYWAQERNEERIIAFAKSFCTPEVVAEIEPAQRQYLESDAPCWDVLTHTHVRVYGEPEKHLRWHLEKIRAAGDEDAAQALERHYREFAARAPSYLTAGLWKELGRWNPLRMLTATLAHGDWDHVIGNLFFFVAFAMVVETVVGPVIFLLIFLAMGLMTGALQNLLTVPREGAVSLGLSGVVMATMTLAAYFAPRTKIKFFYFFFLFIGVLSLPLWSVAAWYVGWNIFDYVYYRDWSPINYAGHLSGAAAGLILGLALFRGRRHWAAENLVADERSLTEEEPWLSKLNAIAATPVVMAFVFFGFLLALWLLIEFFERFAAQVLLVAPAAAAAWQLYRTRRHTTDYERYQRAAQAFDGRNFAEALRLLEPLAQKNYPRALYLLGRLRASAPGAWRDEQAAIELYQRAADRGHAEAQYTLGTMCADGRGIGKDVAQAVRWYERAAAAGMPEAAMSLAYLSENGVGIPADRERAIEWYHRAAMGFLKARRRDEAMAAIAALEALASKYPAVLDLVATLRVSAATMKG